MKLRRRRAVDRWLVRLSVPIVVILVASGCTSGRATPAVAESPTVAVTTSSPAQYQPAYSVVACDGPLFAGRLSGTATGAECGTLTVPEDRSKVSGRQVVLPVAILRSTDPNKRADPYVYFSGGPGDGGIESGGRLLDAGLVPTDRDFIWFDQRGTGRAAPSLNCPETLEALYRRFESLDDPSVEDGRAVSALDACVQRLRPTADLTQYDTPTTARDVTDLRRALGIDEWNIFGISYGTTVALEVLRSQSSGVRSAVIDSVFPSFVPDGLGSVVSSADRVFKKLFDGCAADAACRERYPNFKADAEGIVTQLDATPYHLSYADDAGVQRAANLTGQDLMSALYMALYRSTLIPLIPSFVDQIKHGDFSVLDLVGSQLLPALAGNSDGVTYSVECADRQSISSSSDITALRKAHPLYGAVLSRPSVPQDCPTMHVPSVVRAFNEVPRTRIPTLVFGDEYDPVTPPQDSAETARRLGPKATFVLFPGLGHGATSAADCPRQIFRAFLDDPTAKVDTACVGSMTPPHWSV